MEVKEIMKQEDSSSLIAFLDGLFAGWLEKSAFAKENLCCPGRTYDQIKEKIRQMDENPYEFIVCMDNQKAVGMTYVSYYEEDCLYLGLINVHPEHRKKGVFRLLLAKAEEICNARKIACIRLCTWQGNDAAIQTFQKCGFTMYHENETSVELRKHI